MMKIYLTLGAKIKLKKKKVKPGGVKIKAGKTIKKMENQKSPNPNLQMLNKI